MDKRLFVLSIVAVLLSFAGGFLLANSLNRNELSAVRAENENLKRAQSEKEQNEEDGNLSVEEIRDRIAEADRSPDNILFQKNLGLALYNYASMKQNSDLLREVSRLVARVHEKNPDDYEAVVALGNINFDLGFFNRNNENFARAREFYNKALQKKPSDADVRTDLGLTYLLANPPENAAAIAEFEKSLKTNPKNEKTLQAIVEALTNENKRDEAEKYAAQLREINPTNPSLAAPNSTANGAETDSQK